jgi:hypothetical protein
MQSWIKRSMLHLKKVVCGPLNVLADLVAVRRSIKERSQDEHVKRALQQIRPLLYLLCHRRRSTFDERDGRHSTINCQECKSIPDHRVMTSGQCAHPGEVEGQIAGSG